MKLASELIRHRNSCRLQISNRTPHIDPCTTSTHRRRTVPVVRPDAQLDELIRELLGEVIQWIPHQVLHGGRHGLEPRNRHKDLQITK